ncbi:MAG: leucyl aminopeptidase [Candidatus Methylomirabilales bacterium]
MNVNVQVQDLLAYPGDALIVNLFEGVKKPAGATGAVDQALGGLISQLIAQGEFHGKGGTNLLLHTQGRLKAGRVLVVGLGKREEFGPESVRSVTGEALRLLRRHACRRVGTILHGTGVGGLGYKEAAQAVTEGALLGLYTFDRYKKKEEDRKTVQELTILLRERKQVAEVHAAAETGQVIANAVNLARDLVNEPSNTLTPQALAARARAMAKGQKLTCQVLERRQLERMGMGAFLGVAQGSSRPPVLLVLSYQGGRGKQPALGLVGKGITFDSGGISIKPSEGMEQMKGDMAGAAAVIAAMEAIARLKPAINVTAIVPACENLPSGSALKPGDVVRTMDGKTIEVVNTDAEGRLILADALCYARKLGCQRLVNAATLTGACVVALGSVRSGAFTNNEAWMSRVQAAAEAIGEKIWHMPMDGDYDEQIKSDVADIRNIGGRKAGAITAAKLLARFVGDTPWVHLDIAGTSQADKEKGYTLKGATGVPARTLIRLALDLAKSSGKPLR